MTRRAGARTTGRTAIAGLLALVVAGAAVATVAAGTWRSPAEDAIRKLSAVEVSPEPIGPPNALPAESLAPPPGTTERISVSDGEGQANAGSGGVSALIAGANGDQAISGDGRWVAFISSAANLAQGGSHPGWIVLRDRQDGTTQELPWIRGAELPPGVVAAEPSISFDGSVVAFTVITTDTVGGIAAGGGGTTPYVLLWDRFTGTELVSMDDNGRAAPGFQPSVSADGQFVAYTRWAPVATPPPTPTPAPNHNPTISGLASNRSCLDLSAPTSTISVNAVDPDGDPLTLRIVLSWSDGSNTFFRFPIAMTPAGGNTWTYNININDLNSYGWAGGGPIHYAVTARDSRGADSPTLNDNPSLEPQVNSVYYAPSGCTIL